MHSESVLMILPIVGVTLMAMSPSTPDTIVEKSRSGQPIPFRERLRGGWIVVCILVLIGVLHSSAIASDHQIDQQEVSELILQLNASTRLQRIQAERKLIEMGEGVLSRLSQLRKSNPELDFQLSAIQHKIRSATAETSLNGTMVTLPSSKPTSLTEAVQQIRTQSRMDVNVSASVANIEVQISNEPQTFWKTIDDLSKTGDIGWRHENQAILFSPQSLIKHGATDYPKCLRVAAIHSLRKQTFRGGNRDSLATIGFRIDVEPNIEPFLLKVHDDDFRLTTTDRKTLLPFTPEANRVFERNKNPWFEFRLNFLNAAEPISADVVNVQGKVQLLCAARQQLLIRSMNSKTTLNDPIQKFSVQDNEEKFRVEIEILMDEGIQQLDSHQLALLHRNVWLLEKNQNRIKPIQKEILNIEGLKHTVQFKFPPLKNNSKQIKFQYLYPEFLTITPIELNVNGIKYHRR